MLADGRGYSQPKLARCHSTPISGSESCAVGLSGACSDSCHPSGAPIGPRGFTNQDELELSIQHCALGRLYFAAQGLELTSCSQPLHLPCLHPLEFHQGITWDVCEDVSTAFLALQTPSRPLSTSCASAQSPSTVS